MVRRQSRLKQMEESYARIDILDTRTDDNITYICTTFTFGMNIRMKKIGRSRREITASSYKIYSFVREEKVRLKGGEMVFHSMETTA